MKFNELAQLVEQVMLKEAEDSASDPEWASKCKGSDLEIALRDAWNKKDPPEKKCFKTIAGFLAQGLKSDGLAGLAEKPDAGTVSQLWSSVGGSDGTAKADLNIGNNYRMSMKMGTSARLFTLQKGDARGCLYAALLAGGEVARGARGGFTDPKINKVMNTLKNLNLEMLPAAKNIIIKAEKALENNEAAFMSRTPEQTFMKQAKVYPRKPEREKARKQMRSKEEEDPTAGGKVEPGKSTRAQQIATLDAIQTGQQLADFIRGPFQIIQNSAREIETVFLNYLSPETNPGLELRFFQEALTGRAKFGGSVNPKTKKLKYKSEKQTANYLLLTQTREDMQAAQPNLDAKDSKVLYELTPMNKALFKRVQSEASWRVASKTDNMKEKIGNSKYYTGLNKLRDTITAEIKGATEHTKEFKKKIAEFLPDLTEAQLNELDLRALVSRVGGALKKGAIALKDKLMEGFVKAVKSLINFFKSKILPLVEKAAAYLKKAYDAFVIGGGAVLDLLNITPNDYLDFFEGLEEMETQKIPTSVVKESQQKEKKDLTKAKFSYKMLVETIQEEIEIMEQKNTLGADVNEILMGYYAGGENWNIYGSQAGAVQQAVEQRKAQISPEEYADQDGRAREQAKASLEWAAANGFDGKLVQTWWTARPGVLAKAVETEVDSKKNPTDTLYKFSSDAFLGVSAKSTKGKGEIGFKNPGIGSLGKSLGVDLVGVAKPKLIDVSKKLDWGDAKTAVARKQYLKDIGAYPMPKGSRTPTPAGEPYYSAGHQVLAVSRDALMKAYLDMPIEDLKEHFLDEWIDAKDRYPYYIKVTGHGKNGNYSASLMDPLNNDKLKKISSEHIELEDIGLSSIGVWAGEGADATKLFKIRFKWESSPLTSGLKLSGERF